MSTCKPNQVKPLNCALVNTRSCIKKTQDIQHLLTDRNLDICALVETWIKTDDNITPIQLCPQGYKCLSTSRTDRQGGLNIKQDMKYNFNSMECTDYQIALPGKEVRLGLIYRPPEKSVLDFVLEFAEYMEENINFKGEHLLIGDFNIHMNNKEHQDTITFMDMLDTFALGNHIDFPTHKLDNTLDLVISNSASNIIGKAEQGELFSDHYVVLFNLCISNAISSTREISYRKIKSINIEELQTDIYVSDIHTRKPDMDVETLTDIYNDTLKRLINIHAPVKTKKISNRRRLPWFTDEIAEAIRCRRRLEKCWKKDKTSNEKYEQFHKQRRTVSNLMDSAERKFFFNKIIENKSNYKEVYNVCNQLLGRDKDSPLPPNGTNKELADRFNIFFTDKITKIRHGLENKIQELGRPPNFVADTLNVKIEILEKFTKVTPEHVECIIKQVPPKSCESDPIPTNLLRDILPSVLNIITDIINSSLQQGVFPDAFKVSLVKPLLKKANLDLIYKNYRPVSNLQFISKLVERVAVEQLVDHVNRNNLMEVNQSAYRELHSTETALVKVREDILKAIDNKEIMCLVLLDLSAAFDVIDHQKLLARMELRFGLSGTVLKWIKSYITGRSQKVVIGDLNSNGAESGSTKLDQGVPQGSVLGPICFTWYTCPLGDICRSHGIYAHFYADDSQIYMTFKPSRSGDKDTVISKLEACIEDIREWMTHNLLKLNEDKTEFIVFGTRQQLEKVDTIAVKIGTETITPTDMVHNLGYFMDKHLKNSQHINKIVSTAYLQLKDILRIRPSLNTKTAQVIMQALVLSKIDYCNVLLNGSPEYQIDKVQRIQNMACRVVCQLRKFDHITLPMSQLHWLKVHERIKYKTALFMFKCINNQAPEYLMDIIPRKQHCRTLQLSTSNYIPPKFTRNSQVRNSAFACIGPRVWNGLPSAITNIGDMDMFKKELKMHLYTVSYG